MGFDWRLGMIIGNTASSRVAISSSGPTFRSASTAQSSTGSLTTTIPSGAAAGDVLVLVIWILYNGKAGTVGTPPTGWTQRSYVDTSSGSSEDFVFGVYTKTAGSSEPSAVWSGGSNWINGQSSMIAVSGATAVDVTGSIASGFTASSITTTTATDLLIGIWANYTGGVSSGLGPFTGFPSPMTSRSSVIFNDFTYKELSVGTKTLSTSGATGTLTATWSGNPAIFSNYCVLLAVK